VTPYPGFRIPYRRHATGRSIRPLLPQAHGFEGFGSGAKPLQAPEPSIAKPKHVGFVHLDRNVAPTPHGHDPCVYDDCMAQVSELLRFPADLRKHLLGLAPELLGSFRASIHLRVGELGAFV
jgi:hypothetical protein